MTGTNDLLAGQIAAAVADAMAKADGHGNVLSLWSGWIQLGFAGFCLILVLLIVWLVRNILRDRREDNKVLAALHVSITQNTEVTRSVGASVDKNTEVTRSLGASLDTLTRTMLQVREVDRKARPYAT